VADDRRDLKAARKVERRGRVVENGVDAVTLADVERERDPCVDLRLIELCEVMEASPVVCDERAVVDGVGVFIPNA